MKVELLWSTPKPTEVIEYATRICYDSHDRMTEGSAAKLVRSCMNKGHYSITEHASASFHVTGVTRSLLAQLSRHRHISLSVRSQRYCKEDGFTHTPLKDYESVADELFERAMKDAESAYKGLLAIGVKAEDARGVLPNSCHTEFVVTANFRTWYEFIEKRTHRAAQQEIREMATRIELVMKDLCPAVFDG